MSYSFSRVDCEERIDGCYVELAASLDICKDWRGIPVDPFGQQLPQGLQVWPSGGPLIVRSQFRMKTNGVFLFLHL